MLPLVVGLSGDQYVQLSRLNLGYKAASYLTLVAHLEFVRLWEMCNFDTAFDRQRLYHSAMICA